MYLQDTTDVSAVSAAVAQSVKDLMLRKGTPDRQLSKKLSEILELSYSQAHRKLSGGVEWAFGDLVIVANYFGETVSPIRFSGESSPAPLKTSDSASVEAVFVVRDHEIPCRVRVGPILHTLRNVDFVAVNVDDVWRVVEVEACAEQITKYKVEELHISIKRTVPSVAIVDDERGFADNLRDYLTECGFNAKSFYDSSSIERAAHEQEFDGFVIDWLLGDQTAESLIRQIRSSLKSSTPIFLLTGEFTTGRADESEVARVIRQFDVVCQEKPARLPIIAAELSKALGC